MHASLQACLATALLSAATLSPAQAIAAYHDADTAVHETQVATLTNAGYRPITLTIYGTAASPRYAAVWVQRLGPNFQEFHGLTSAQYQALVVANQNTHVPAIVSASGAGSGARFAGVLVQAGHSVWARHDQTQAQFDAEVSLARTGNWRIASADAYGTANDPRYIVSFEPNPDDVGWGHYHASGTSGQQTLFDAMSQAYARPRCTSCNDDGSRFLSCWEDTMVGQVISHHDLTSAAYQQLATQYYQNNYYPIHLAASGSGANVRFAASWATRDLPFARQWTTTGAFVPELASFDAWVQNWMQSNGIRGASLAVVKDSKLKLARGYTWAEPGYAAIQPTSLFRIASCTKPLTSIAVHQQIQNTPGAIGYGRLMAGYFNNPSMADNRANQITIEHLLTHEGGWDRTAAGSNFDPMFLDTTIATAGSLQLPISATNIRTYMQGQPLDFTPGNNAVYSNYGFTLLARIMERINPGKTFEQIVQERVFAPLGVTRPQIGGAHRADRLPGEVLYHPRSLGVSRSVNDNSRPWVASHYGAWNQENMDGNGAWVMSAPDYAKVLAAFDLGLFNPILGPTQTGNMWTLGTGASFLKGWWINSQPTSVELREHNGILPGTRCYVGRRADGISFVLFTNGDQTLGSTQGAQLSGLADAVSAWPGNDLFGSTGIPSFQHVDDLMSPFGSPCPGSTGTPRFIGSGSADIGQRPSLDLSFVLPNTAAFCIVGFSPTNYDLTPMGAPGCVIQVTPLFNELLFTDAAGNGSYVLQLPLEHSLVGAHLFAQDAVLDPAANQLGIHVTTGIDITVGGWLGQ